MRAIRRVLYGDSASPSPTSLQPGERIGDVTECGLATLRRRADAAEFARFAVSRAGTAIARCGGMIRILTAFALSFVLVACARTTNPQRPSDGGVASPPGDSPTPGGSGGSGGGGGGGGAPPTDGGSDGGGLTVPPNVPFFAGALVEQTATVTLSGASEGDLWPSCWSDDDNVYAANGDGRAFDVATNPTPNAYDVAVSRISGSPDAPSTLAGVTRASSAAVASVWSGTNYNRKPTGMLCRHGDLYIAVQDLRTNTFSDAPAASISVSHDKGATWTWDHNAPMFANHVFTTIFFLDFGKDSANAIDDYVYVYGIDQNWATQAKLYLARVPQNSVQDRSQWTFFAGLGSDGKPRFVADIAARVPVLEDDRHLYSDLVQANYTAGGYNMQPVAQGSVVYDAPLKRYLYSSWTEETQEFYESPTPWGPWTLFHEADFGLYPWSSTKYGGYAATIPSKFISADGKTMWVQSNCWGGAHGCAEYYFALRKLSVTPWSATQPQNGKSAQPLTGGATPLFRALHYGGVAMLSDGNLTSGDDSWSGERNASDWWGYTWPQAQNVNSVVYTSGKQFPDGGWFTGLKVQVRQYGVWKDVTQLTTTPAYPFDGSANPFRTFTFAFADTWGDGVRIVGAPGGTATFTTIAELAVYFR